MTRGMSTAFCGAMALAVGATAGAPSCAQSQSRRPIRILTAPIGGALDMGARIIAPAITDGLGQQAVVDNRGGIIGIETAAQARPDGHTLLVHGSIVWLLPFMRERTSWDPIRDFAPITLAMFAPNILVVHPNVRAKTVQELIALAKAKPGELNYASGAAGTITHLAGEMFKSMTDTNIVRIPYSGTGPGLTAMLGGEVHMMFPAALSALPHLKSGRLIALGVTSLQPSPVAPGLPTVASAGLPGFESGASVAVLAPAGTSSALLGTLYREITRYLSQPAVRDKLSRAGIEVVGSSPAQFEASMKSDMSKWGKVIKAAGIQAE